MILSLARQPSEDLNKFYSQITQDHSVSINHIILIYLMKMRQLKKQN